MIVKCFILNLEMKIYNRKSERKESLDKDTFNFNTTVNQKEGDEWDFQLNKYFK